VKNNPIPLVNNLFVMKVELNSEVISLEYVKRTELLQVMNRTTFTDLGIYNTVKKLVER
jgi:hypothetical protein